VTVTLEETGESASFDLGAIGPRRGHWIDYVAGTAWAMDEAGLATQGFRALLGSDLPQGSGLSSSAALELASALALSGGTQPVGDRMQLALIAQRAETGYVGLQSGLMDQFASAHGEPGAALLLDCRSLDHRAVALRLDGLAIVAADSGSPRRLDATAYNERHDQCLAAAGAIAQRYPAVRSLRDVTPDMLAECGRTMDPLLARRARHVVEEDARVIEAVGAFESGQHARTGGLLLDSHASLRDLYDVSSPELDALVETAMGVDGVYGARLTGAGFGGCTVNLVRRDAIDRLAEAISTRYAARTGLMPRVFEVTPSLGARRIDGWR